LLALSFTSLVRLHFSYIALHIEFLALAFLLLLKKLSLCSLLARGCAIEALAESTFTFMPLALYA
jgi:hypothetical protein